MTLEITDIFGNRVELQPRVELYSVRDFMGQEMPGLAIALDEIVDEPYGMEPYATLTVSFGEFIGLKNSAYIDTNNCRFAQQLLNQGFAEDTGCGKAAASANTRSGPSSRNFWRRSAVKTTPSIPSVMTHT